MDDVQKMCIRDRRAYVRNPKMACGKQSLDDWSVALSAYRTGAVSAVSYTHLKYTPAEVRNDPYGFTYKEMSEVICVVIAYIKQSLFIHSTSGNGGKPVKKIPASATVLPTMKVEVQSLSLIHI